MSYNFDGLGRPSSLNSDSPFAIADHALHDTSTPKAPTTATPRPRPQAQQQQQQQPGRVVQYDGRAFSPVGQVQGGYDPRYPPQQQQQPAGQGYQQYPVQGGQPQGQGQGPPRQGYPQQQRPPPPQQSYSQSYQQPPPPPPPQPPQSYQQPPQQQSYQQPAPPQSYQQPPPPPPPQPYQQPPPQSSQGYPQPPGGYPQPPNPPRPASAGQYQPQQYQPPPPPPVPLQGQYQPPRDPERERRSNPNPPNSAGSSGSGQGQRPMSASSGSSRGGTDEAELWKMFAAIDLTRSGQLTAKDVQKLLNQQGGRQGGGFGGVEAREDCVKMLMNIFDTDRSGSINFVEFEGLWRYIKDWHAIFDRFDRDRSGTIDRRELGEALQSFGFGLPGDLVRRLEKRFAPPKTDGAPKGISFDRFLMACITVKHYTEAFRKRDIKNEGRLTLDYNTFMEMVIDSPS